MDPNMDLNYSRKIGPLEQFFCVGLGSMLSYVFRFMFANICFEKNQNSKVYVISIINIT
jgi:hypothetical protein